MNNGNLPAAPILGDTDAYVLFLEGIKGGNNYGLTKREHFAGMMLQGMYADLGDNCTSYGILAESAVKAADALLKELDQ